MRVYMIYEVYKRLGIFSIIVNSAYPLRIFINQYEKVSFLTLSESVLSILVSFLSSFSLFFFPFMKINYNKL